MAASGFDDHVVVSLAEDETTGRRTLREPRLWLVAVFFLCQFGTGYAYSFSAPAIIVAVAHGDVYVTEFAINAVAAAL